MLRCPTEQTYQDARERDIVRSCCFISLVFPGKNEGQGEGGGVFSWWKEKKNLEKEEIFHVFFFHLPFFLSRDAFFNTLKRSRARELKRERERKSIYTHTHTHTHTHTYNVFTVMSSSASFLQSSVVHNNNTTTFFRGRNRGGRSDFTPKFSTKRTTIRKASGGRKGTCVTIASIDTKRDVVLVFGCLDRTAQCSAEQLSMNEKSQGVRVVSVFPAKAFEGIKNPLDAMAKELVYPNQKTIDAMNDFEYVEVVSDESKEYQEVLPNVTAVIIADEFAPNMLKSTEGVVALIKENKLPKLKRVVGLSHIGIDRRDQDPYKMMNRKLFRGGAILDRWSDAEELIKATSPKGNPLEVKWTYTIIRVGDLRGNGPCAVVYGDAMLTLVDNAFDVRMQDVDMEPGDKFDGFTKRLSAACVMNRMLTSSKVSVLNQTFSLISVGPVPRDRRKGYDVAKGRSPPPIRDEEIDEAVQPKGKEEEQGSVGGAPVPT